jgi:hypothetical protein
MTSIQQADGLGLRAVRPRRYLGRDFDSLRAMLLEYARIYHPNSGKDFSEASPGGLFLDFAAFVGDNLSFYLDHQFGELDPETAVETANIERALRGAGVPIVGAAPAVVRETFFARVPAQLVDGTYVPMPAALPTFLEGSIVQADNGTEFVLTEDVDLGETSDGRLIAEVRIGDRRPTGQPLNFIVAADGVCVSGQQVTESFALGAFVPFRKITLSNPNVTDIISITDDLGNTYHVVGSLTHDVVYRNVLSTAHDSDVVRDALRPAPAPYRCVPSVDLGTRRTTLMFGGGSASTLEDDVIPDPTDFAIPMPYSKTFSRIPVNPERLLQTKTLGVAASDTTLHVIYRHGGGLGHCVPFDTIRTLKTLRMAFPRSPSAAIASEVRGSVEVTNRAAAAGGEDPPTVDELKSLIPSIRNTQERIVTREDLLARVYTLPSNFGRVFRAAIRSNPNNPLATQLFIVSRDSSSRLTMSPDTLKQNLVTYLNPYRMISDAIDILDARIINIGLAFEIVVDPALNRSIVLQAVLRRLQTVMHVKNFHIDQPIIVDDIKTAIYTTPGIMSINALRLQNIVGSVGTRRYSDETHDIAVYTKKGLLIPPPGGIFECRYAEHDIVGRAV